MSKRSCLRWCFSLLLLGVGTAQATSVVLPPDINHTELHESAEDCDVAKSVATVDALTPASRTEEINRLDREGYTPLAYAARRGCIELVTHLVAAGAIVDAADARSGWTPLLQAADQRHVEVVRFLLARGANVNVKTEFGQTPLTVAILGSVFSHGPAGNRDDTIGLLLANGADVNLQGIFGWTPLMTAVFRADAGVVRLLVAKGANVLIRDEEGKTALDHAIKREQREIVEILENSISP